MSTQHEVTKRQKLLNGAGNVAEPGYAKTPVWEYDRADIKAAPLRVKEWDYYLVNNDRYAVAMTVADNHYMGLLSISLMDFHEKSFITRSKMSLLPRNRTGHSFTSSEGDIKAEGKGFAIQYRHTAGGRRIACSVDKFQGTADFTAEFQLTDIPPESMVIATPFDKPKHFYYNQKINCMKASGKAVLGGNEILFDKRDSMAILDWGRGVWPRKDIWYWATASGYADGVPFGFNLGYGFGNTSAASENMLFYDGRAHKLTDVDFGIPVKPDGQYDYMEQWHFTSSDNRLDFIFDPILDRRDKQSFLGFVATDQHQVFGRANGFAVLDDGRKIEFRGLIASCEVIKNKW